MPKRSLGMPRGVPLRTPKLTLGRGTQRSALLASLPPGTLANPASSSRTSRGTRPQDFIIATSR